MILKDSKDFLEDIQKLEAEINEKVCAVFEATGVYTKLLERFLSKNSIKTYIINPLESARKRKEEIHNKRDG
ncbi:MAG: IS110 family transposase [Holdemanella porci]